MCLCVTTFGWDGDRLPIALADAEAQNTCRPFQFADPESCRSIRYIISSTWIYCSSNEVILNLHSPPNGWKSMGTYDGTLWRCDFGGLRHRRGEMNIATMWIWFLRLFGFLGGDGYVQRDVRHQPRINCANLKYVFRCLHIFVDQKTIQYYSFRFFHC